MPPPKPMLQAAVLCDQAIQDRASGKWTLVGCFTRINFFLRKGLRTQDVSRPIVHQRLAIYFCVSGAAGDYRFEVEVRHLTNSETRLLSIAGVIKSGGSRLQDTEFAVNIVGMQFPDFGRYRFVLLMNGIEIGSKPFDVCATVMHEGEAR